MDSACVADPFDDSMSELRMLIASARSIQSNATQRGVVTEDAVQALRDSIDGAEEILRMQQQVLAGVREGKIKGSVLPPVVSSTSWLQRESAVVDASNELYELSHSAKKIIAAFDEKRAAEKQRQLAAAASQKSAAAGRAADAQHDEFLQSQLDEQDEMTRDQDQALDRIHSSLKSIQNNATVIHEELGRQEGLLDTAQKGMDVLKVKLATANQKVDTLLNSMSDCRKICIIIVLCIILGFLVVSIL